MWSPGKNKLLLLFVQSNCRNGTDFFYFLLIKVRLSENKSLLLVEYCGNIKEFILAAKEKKNMPKSQIKMGKSTSFDSLVDNTKLRV